MGYSQYDLTAYVGRCNKSNARILECPGGVGFEILLFDAFNVGEELKEHRIGF